MRTRVLLGTAVTASVVLSGVPADAGRSTQIRVSVQPVERDERPRIRVHVPVPDGVDDPSGRVLLEVRLPGRDYRDQRRIAWGGTDLRFALDRVTKPGRYVVRAVFVPDTEEMRGATAEASFRVSR